MADADPADLLCRYRRIAVVGFSDTPGKDAHSVPLVLRRAGYEVTPVNPNHAEVAGTRSYPALRDVPGPLEIVNVFRPSSEAPRVAREAVAAGARALWLQLGIRHPEARRIAGEAGMAYVEDRCIQVELRRLAG